MDSGPPPHGDLAYDIVEAVYPEDLRNVLLFDLLKVGFSLNPFELPRYKDKAQREIMVERMIGEIVSFMKKLYGDKYWGPSLNRIFQNALRRLYQNDDSPTFKEMLDLVKEELDKEEYKDFYDDLGSLPKGRTDAVINKLEPFVKNDLLRKIFCQKVSTVDIEELLKPNRLVIWRLPKGELSEMNAGLIGSALITKLWLTVVSRERSSRSPVFLAIDEFQNFAHLQTLGDMVTEGRKYRVAPSFLLTSIQNRFPRNCLVTSWATPLQKQSSESLKRMPGWSQILLALLTRVRFCVCLLLCLTVRLLLSSGAGLVRGQFRRLRFPP
ncbi:MAG: hypothetical protein KAW19_04600 [Candidatus Aminicenantes bacterium]|nr:hypothetical protein [Candidatus Aminicenantes bacterium]